MFFRRNTTVAPVSASTENLADFWTVVEAASSLTEEEADRLQDIYEQEWGRRFEKTGTRAAKAAERAGRIDDDIDYAIDCLCGIVGGAADVAYAVLARDLISGEDFALLTGWWTSARLPVTA